MLQPTLSFCFEKSELALMWLKSDPLTKADQEDGVTIFLFFFIFFILWKCSIIECAKLQNCQSNDNETANQMIMENY